MNSIAMLDIILMIIMFIFAIRCILQGFLRELISMTSWICGILGAIFFYRQAADFIRNNFFQDIPILPEVLAFFGVFFVIFLIIKVLEVLLKDVLDMIRLGAADRFMGFLLGLVEGLVCAVVLLFIINIQPIFDTEPIFAGSIFAERLLPIIQLHSPELPRDI